MTYRIIPMLLFLGLVVACDNNEEGGKELNPTEAKARISEISDEMQSDVIEMVQTEGMTALMDLVDLWSLADFNGARSTDVKAIKKVQETIEDVSIAFNPMKRFTDETEDEEFDFEANKGVYEWSFEKQKFLPLELLVDYIEIRFPTKDSETNNAVFKLLEFETDDTLEEGLPSKIVAELYIDEQLQASLLLDITYSEFIGVAAAELRLFLNPFNFEIGFTAQTSSVAIAASVSRDDVPLMGVSLVAHIDNPITQQVSIIEGNIFYRALKVEGELDAKVLEAAETPEEINEGIDVSLYYDNDKIGDLVMGDDFEFYIEFANGEKELLEDFLAPIFDELAGVITSLEDA